MKIHTFGVARASTPASYGGYPPVALPPPPVPGTRTGTVLELAAGTAALRGLAIRTSTSGKKERVVA